MDLKTQMDNIYAASPADEIPWNIEQPPEILVDLVESGRVQACDAVDMGCGTGNYAVWLARRGFRMTGLDISEKGLLLAERRAAEKSVNCRFLPCDLRDGNVSRAAKLERAFDFAFDWEVLHHVFPDERERYVLNVSEMLRPGGRYLSVCFSEDDAATFGARGKTVETPLGTTLYFSSERELRALFESCFRIDKLETVSIGGKYGPHRAISALMTKTND